MRRRRGPQSGAETLEFCAVAGLIGFALVLGANGISYVDKQLRAQDDARTLARDAAVCERGWPSLSPAAVDPDATATTVQPERDLVAVTVTLPGVEIMPRVAATVLVPRATVAMRKEPGCP